MVTAAVVAFLLFYFLVVRWYLPTMWDVPNWDRPLVFSRSWFHVSVWLTAVFLFLVSVIGLFTVNWWLSLVPFVVLFALIAKQRFKKESKIDATIKKAILLHYELKQKGLPEHDIY